MIEFTDCMPSGCVWEIQMHTLEQTGSCSGISCDLRCDESRKLGDSMGFLGRQPVRGSTVCVHKQTGSKSPLAQISQGSFCGIDIFDRFQQEQAAACASFCADMPMARMYFGHPTYTREAHASACFAEQARCSTRGPCQGPIREGWAFGSKRCIGSFIQRATPLPQC